MILKSSVLFIIFIGYLFGNSNKMQVFQPLSSTCPKSWFKEMETVSSKLEVIDMISVKGLKKEVGIPREIQSCNTSILNDFIFEGNVPAKAIKDFFKKRPKKAIGLALPAYENDKDPKTVYVIFEDKSYKEFGKY